MDRKVDEINRLAESLLDRGIAASMDEAIEEAKERILEAEQAPPPLSRCSDRVQDIEENISDLAGRIEHEVQRVTELQTEFFKDMEQRIEGKHAEKKEKPAEKAPAQVKPAKTEEHDEPKMTVDQVTGIIRKNQKAVDLIKRSPEEFMEKTRHSDVLSRLFKHVDINDVINRIRSGN